MTAPTPRPPSPAADTADNGMLWFVLPALVILIAVMLIATQQDSATEVITVGEATPDQIATGQTALASVGCYTGEIDGKYGTQTDQAILDFQRASGIAVDGVFGPVTLAALQDAVDTGSTVCAPTGSTDTGDTDGEAADTREAVLSSASYGPQTFTVTSWDCTGEPGDLSLEGTSDAALTITVAMVDGAGTLLVDGGTEQDGITLNGTMATLTKEPSSFAATGTFDEPNLIGETYDLMGTC